MLTYIDTNQHDYTHIQVHYNGVCIGSLLFYPLYPKYWLFSCLKYDSQGRKVLYNYYDNCELKETSKGLLINEIECRLFNWEQSKIN